MLKKTLAAAVAGAALALPVPAAHADEPSYGCKLMLVAAEAATGRNYEGVATGYVAHSETGPVSIRCTVTVNGVEVASTPTGTGIAAAVTAGRISFPGPVDGTDTVFVVAEATTFHGTHTRVHETATARIAPQEVEDVVGDVVQFLAPLRDVLLDVYVDPVLCPVLAMLQGSYGPLTIGPDGDVDLTAAPLYECPPDDPAGTPLPVVWLLHTRFDEPL
jgi:hypothetical protein